MKLGHWLDKVREQKPLVHNITNLVVNNIAANALLTIGASPVMAYAKEEAADMARIASALSLNMGTLTPEVVEAMLIAGQSAAEANVPIVFDPVGVGATPYRNETAETIVRTLPVRVIRGNAGEMSVMLGIGGAVKGVDSSAAGANLPQAMKEYAKENGIVLVATGEVDYVTDGESIWSLQNGHPLLSAITGSGCMLTAILGGFVGVCPKEGKLSDYAEASVAAITAYNVASELAEKLSAGPGTFQAHLFDALYSMNADTVDSMARVEVAR